MTVPVIIDIIAAVLLIGFTLYGAKRGLFRALAGLLIIILALAGARFAAEGEMPGAASDALVRALCARAVRRRGAPAAP